MKVKGRFTKHEDLINTGQWKFTAFEMLINAISPMPFLLNVTYSEFYYVDRVSVDAKINTILFIVMVLSRLYHLMKSILISTYYMTTRAYRVTSIYGVSSSYLF